MDMTLALICGNWGEKTMKKFDLKAIIVGLLLIIIGILSILCDIFMLKTEKAIWISIGCSLLASGIVILMQAWLVDAKKISSVEEEWGLTKIYKTRADKGADSDKDLHKATYKLDVIAFGLKSFRSVHKKEIENILKKGVMIRILTMDPSEENIFLEQREKEENESKGQIANSIKDLVKWADDNNTKKYKGKIEVRGYQCMTLDFYWRLDDDLYIGPYWYGIGSQQTITYRFKKGRKGFDIYAEYFENLWSNEELTKVLTKKIERRRNRGRESV